MIDLTRFTKEQGVVLPIIDGWGQYGGRKIYLPKIESGWYKAALGSGVTLHGRANALEVFKALDGGVWNKQRRSEKRMVHGPIRQHQVYALGEEGVPTSFDAFIRRGIGESVRVYFMSVRIFETARIVEWEDGRFYFFDTYVPKNREVIQRVRESFNRDENLSGLRGITPELRYYFLLANLQRQSYRAMVDLEQLKLSERERARRVEEFKRTISGRLEAAVRSAGATLVKYSKLGSGYLVEWKIDDQIVKSHIRDDMRIINAGFCLSGSDAAHTLNSLVHLAKLFQEDEPLYLTRE